MILPLRPTLRLDSNLLPDGKGLLVSLPHLEEVDEIPPGFEDVGMAQVRSVCGHLLMVLFSKPLLLAGLWIFRHGLPVPEERHIAAHLDELSISGTAIKRGGKVRY